MLATVGATDIWPSDSLFKDALSASIGRDEKSEGGADRFILGDRKLKFLLIGLINFVNFFLTLVELLPFRLLPFRTLEEEGELLLFATIAAASSAVTSIDLSDMVCCQLIVLNGDVDDSKRWFITLQFFFVIEL